MSDTSLHKCECGVGYGTGWAACPACGKPREIPNPHDHTPYMRPGGLPASVRILGIPWKVELVDLIDNDPDNGSAINHGQSIIRLSSDNPPQRMRWHLFWGVLAALQCDLARNLVPQPDEYDIIHQAIWTGISDNRAAVAGWFGLCGGDPEVREGTVLRCGGLNYSLLRPPRLPGKGLGYYGLCKTTETEIYVRQGLSPGFASSTALHELIHASATGLTPLWDNEAYVTAMAAGLAQVFFDNPHAMRWIFEGEATPDGPQ